MEFNYGILASISSSLRNLHKVIVDTISHNSPWTPGKSYDERLSHYSIKINKRCFKITKDGVISFNKQILGKATSQDEAFKMINDYYSKLITTYNERKIKKAFDKADIGPYLIKVIENTLKSNELVRGIKIYDCPGKDRLVYYIDFYYDIYTITMSINSNKLNIRLIPGMNIGVTCDLDMQNPNFDPDKTIIPKVEGTIEFVKSISDSFKKAVEGNK